jgi:hypothetical protein
LVLLLLWAAEASASSRISLLPFEGDRPRPLRWRVAYVLKRAGHVVLGYAPPADRSSAASLRNYADQRNVDLFISGNSVETAEGWELSLRFRNADGKAVGKPIEFRADTLREMLIELKSEGPSRLDRAVRSGSPSAVAELPPGRALPLPTRRPARTKPKSDRPVLPGAAPEEEPAAQRPARTAPAEVDLDAAVAASAAGPETWDADGDEPPARSAAKPRRAAKQERATKKTAAQQRLATGGMFSSGAPARKRGDVDLDAATRGALEEESPKSKARPVLEEPEEEVASDPLADPAAPPEVAAAAEPEREVLDADAMDPPEDAASEPASESEAKPRKKGGLFAGRLGRKSPSSDSSGAAEQGAEDTTVEDRDTSSSEEARPAAPRAVLGAHAGFLRRSLVYSDDLYNRLRAPTTNGWVYRFDAAFYPFAQPLKEQVALIASYEGSLGGTVRDARSNRDFGVKFSNIEAGARVRQPIGAHELGLQATVGQLTSGLDAASALTGIPEISYTLLSPSVDLSLNFGDVSLHGALGYQRSVGGFGEVANAQWFPRMEGYGFNGQLGLDYRFSPSVALQAGGVLRRFVLDMNSRPEDATGGQAEVAGGAVDQYLSGYLGISFKL